MEITRSKLFEIDAAARALDASVKNVKLAYALAKSLQKMEGEIAAVRKAGKPSKAFEEYNAKRGPIAAAHAVKDKEGQPTVFNNVYVILDQAGLDAALAPLQEEYAEAIADQKKQAEAMEEMMEGIVDIEFHKVPADMFEKDDIFTKDAAGLGQLLAPLFGSIIDIPV